MKLQRKSYKTQKQLQTQKNLPFVKLGLKSLSKSDWFYVKKNYNTNYFPYKYLNWNILTRFRGNRRLNDAI